MSTITARSVRRWQEKAGKRLKRPSRVRKPEKATVGGMSRVPDIRPHPGVIIERNYRHEQSERERALGMPGRWIHRGIPHAVAADVNDAQKRRKRKSMFSKITELLG